MLGGPGDEIITKVDTVARGGAASVRAARPISVGVAGQCRGGGGMKLEAEVE
jgi:hypothetical protein